MNLRIKFAVLWGGLTLGLGLLLATYFMEQAHAREAALMIKSISNERAEMLNHLIELNGQSLQTFSADYSVWTEMADFLKTGDRHWAEVNIDPSLKNFGAQAAWVLQSDGRQHYAVNHLPPEIGGTFSLTDPEFLHELTQKKTLHFFHSSTAGLIEVRTAPIQLSEDIARLGVPLGWLVVARVWDDAYLEKLARPVQSKASWQTTPKPQAEPAQVHLERNFLGWNRHIVGTLRLDYQPVALLGLIAGNDQESYVLYAFGGITLLLTMSGVWIGVILPLRRLSQALESGRPEMLGDMAQHKSEFGRLAKLVELLFAQQNALGQEVKERAKLERTLRENESELKQSVELLSRLARDLHDGIIQSIYAAGLGLEGVRSVIQTDPALADLRLSASQKALNESISDVRGFITELEPNSPSVPPFSFTQVLTSLTDNLVAFQHVKATVTVDPDLTRRLSPEQEVQILKIARECISNTLRHARARTFHLALQTGTGGDAQLEITDDGEGFDPTQRNHIGRGLLNLTARTKEIGGTLQLHSAPGKGTRIIVHFTPVFPAQS